MKMYENDASANQTELSIHGPYTVVFGDVDALITTSTEDMLLEKQAAVGWSDFSL